MKHTAKPTSPSGKPTRIEGVYRRARKAVRTTEDEALNAVCDARLKETRHPLRPLLKKLGHELDE